MGDLASPNTSASTTQNIDKRISAGRDIGNVLQDSNITVGGVTINKQSQLTPWYYGRNGWDDPSSGGGASHDSLQNVAGGSLTIVEANADIAKAAIQEAGKFSDRIGNTLTKLAQDSNKIAAQVAKSQEQFVATASGQKYVLYIVGGLAVVAVVVLPRLAKSFRN